MVFGEHCRAQYVPSLDREFLNNPFFFGGFFVNEMVMVPIIQAIKPHLGERRCRAHAHLQAFDSDGR